MKRLIRAFGALETSWPIRAFSTSIGKKIVMAVTGLALCGFLIVHLGGNLLLYVGAEQYNNYAHALHSQTVLLWIAEIGLLVLFLGHIVLALATHSENDAARPIGYAVKQTKMEQGPFAAPASAVMMATGLIVLAFILIHLSDFRMFDLRHTAAVANPQPYDRALAILHEPVSALIYTVGSIVLGYHVLHGFQSALQTLGVNHPRYTPLIRYLSIVFAIAVAAGFGSFPFWAMAFKS